MTEILLTFRNVQRRKSITSEFKDSKDRTTGFTSIWYAGDLLHLLTVKKFLLHSASEFLCERKSSIFWRRQKSYNILHRQIRLQTQQKEYFFATARGFETHKVWHINQTKYSATPPTQQTFFLQPRFWVVAWAVHRGQTSEHAREIAQGSHRSIRKTPHVAVTTAVPSCELEAKFCFCLNEVHRRW